MRGVAPNGNGQAARGRASADRRPPSAQELDPVGGDRREEGLLVDGGAWPAAPPSRAGAAAGESSTRGDASPATVTEPTMRRGQFVDGHRSQKNASGFSL